MATHLTDFQREVIVILKFDNPTWGYNKCANILPTFFETISQRQFDRVVHKLKEEGSESAKKRKRGTGQSSSINEGTRQSVLQMAVTPDNSPTKGHSSQRQIARDLRISKGTVFNILKKSTLKCFRKITCQKLTEGHQQARALKAHEFISRFANDRWRRIWFSDEASFRLKAPLNKQNERIYRSVTVKTEIPSDELIVQLDTQQPSLMAYGAVSYYGKTNLYFIEGYTEQRKKKTINQEIYRQEMCPQMFLDIERIMGGEHWIWQQDGARPHTARASIEWLRENTPEFITPDEWPAKSPDLNVMDYSIWSIILSHLQSQRSEIDTVEILKEKLIVAWNSVSLDVIRNCTASWMGRLEKCVRADGKHFEHL